MRKERTPGPRPSLDKTPTWSPIAAHPDVRRTLLTMKALTRAARAICYATAREIDMSRHAETDARPPRRRRPRRAADARSPRPSRPISAARSPRSASRCTAAWASSRKPAPRSIYRDARILPIYEGTNGIQAIDLINRKLPLQGGHLVKQVIAEYETLARRVKGIERLELGRMGQRLASTVVALTEATEWMVEAIEHTPNLALAGATPYLRLFALAAGGHYLAKGALAALWSRAARTPWSPLRSPASSPRTFR